MNKSRDLHTFHRSALAGDAQLQAGFTNATALSDHMQSDLTCNASSSRKRNRDEALVNMEAPIYPHLYVLNSATSSQVRPVQVVSAQGFPFSTDLSFPVFDSAASSTSDQPASAFIPFTAPVSPELISLFHQQDHEIRTLLRYQFERLCLGMEEAQKRYRKALLSILGQHAMKKLKDKETELENASRKNADLEEKVQQMTAEGLIWFNLAKDNEALVSSLKASLEEALIQNAAVSAAPPAREGFGDTEDSPFLADDAQSCCFEKDQRMPASDEATATGTPASGGYPCRMPCKVCREDEVSVLVLPCRHLCLCKACDAGVQTCPVCRFHKNASLQIFMS